MITRLFINTLLRLRLTYLIVESKLKFELGSYAIQNNINNSFLELSSSCL